MHVRGAFNHLLRPGLREDFRDSYESFAKEWPGFLREGNLDRAELEATTISGLPRQVELGEGEAFTIVDAKLAAKITYTPDQYGLGFSVSKDMMEDDLYGKANQNAKWLGRSANLTQEYKAADLLDDAFTGASFTGFAGERLISATHTLLNSGSTWSNAISGNPQLGILGIQAAFELAEQTVDHQGDPIVMTLNKIICNISEQWMAIQLTQNEKEPFTSDNNINAPMRKKELSYTVAHYKSQSASDWFVQDSALHDMHFLWRVRPEFPDWYDDATRSSYFASRQKFLVYFYDPRGIIGSNAS